MRLSFCIPVFNGGDCIKETLESIFREARDRRDIEAVVFDGGSTDDTQEQVIAYAEHEPRVRYVRADKRGGIDKDLCSCVEIASGEFCWLFSAHDLLKPGAIDTLEKYLDERRAVVLVRHSNCTVTMLEYGEHLILSGAEPFEADLGDQAQRMAWLKRAANTEAVFSFISSIVVRRSAWEQGALEPVFEGSCWGHVARFFKSSAQPFIVYSPADVLVQRRGGGDSFSSNGMVRRYALAIDGYLDITRHYFGEGMEVREVRRLLQAEYGLNQFVSAKLECDRSPGRESSELLERLFDALYDGEASVTSAMRKLAFRRAPLRMFDVTREAVRAYRRFRRGEA